MFGWNNTALPNDDVNQRPGDAIREARIRNVNYSAKERGVEGGSDGRDTEKNWFNGNGLAQEAPPRDDGKED